MVTLSMMNTMLLKSHLLMLYPLIIMELWVYRLVSSINIVLTNLKYWGWIDTLKIIHIMGIVSR